MHKTFMRDVDVLPEIFEFTGTFAAGNGLGESASFALNLAVEETFTNMVKYGGGVGAGISLDLAVGDGELIVALTDHGAPPFDPARAPDADTRSELADREPGGLGLHLVHNLMDGVHYEHLDGDVHVTLTKRLED